MNTQALTTEYKHVIPSRFVTRRDGSQMRCTTCGQVLAMGQSYAAVTTQNVWHSYCATCAASYPAQIGGLVKRIDEVVAGLDPVPQVVLDAVANVQGDVERCLTGTCGVPMMVATKADLMGIRTMIGQAKRAATADPQIADRVDRLRAAIGLGAIKPKDINFAQSLVNQWDTKHRLSDKQLDWVDKLAARGASAADASATVEPGLYLLDDQTVYKVYVTRNDRTAAKTLLVRSGRGSFQYVGGGVRRVADALAAGKAHLMTQDEAAAYGRQYGFCVNCGRYLDDDRSLAAGYGETCAGNQGWFYPNYDEASKILGRPAAPKSKPAAPTTEAAPVPPAQREIPDYKPGQGLAR